MIATTSFAERTVPGLLAHGIGCVPESLGADALGQPVTAAQLANSMEPEENLIADIRGTWTPRQIVERKLLALSYTCRPGSFSRICDGGETRSRSR